MWSWSSILGIGGGGAGTAIASGIFYAINASHPAGWVTIAVTLALTAAASSGVGAYFGKGVDQKDLEAKLKGEELAIRDKETEAALLRAKNEEEKNRILDEAQRHQRSLLESLQRESKDNQQIIDELSEIKKGDKPMPEGEDKQSIDLKLKKKQADEELVNIQIKNAQATAAIIANAYKTPREELIKSIESKGEPVDWFKRSWQISGIFLTTLIIPFLVIALVNKVRYYFKLWFVAKENSEEDDSETVTEKPKTKEKQEK